MDNIGIVGEGKMGGSIFNYLLGFDLKLAWICHPEADTEKLYRQFSKRIRRSVDTGIITKEHHERLLKTVISKNPEDLRECDLVIEAIPEITGLKKDLFAKLDGIVRPEAIFASNSSSINPGEIAPAGNRSEKFVGIHFFFPVSLKNIVELTIMPGTSAETITRTESFLKTIQRRHITLTEQNSFMLNRIFLDFQNEAYLLVAAGKCSCQQLDRLVKDHFFPFGVFDFCDSVGLDTMLASVLNYTRGYGDQDYFTGFTGKLAELVANGRLGMKNQAGFFDYPVEYSEIPALPAEQEIMHHLRKIWLSSCTRHTQIARLPIGDANHAIKEYFDLQKGPFD
jgi:3-hydroxyacyl-CoA dehydrogenase